MKRLIAAILFAMTTFAVNGFSASSFKTYQDFRLTAICSGSDLGPVEQKMCECLADFETVSDTLKCIDAVREEESEVSDQFQLIQADLLQKRTENRLKKYRNSFTKVPAVKFERKINREQILEYFNSHSMHF